MDSSIFMFITILIGTVVSGHLFGILGTLQTIDPGGTINPFLNYGGFCDPSLSYDTSQAQLGISNLDQ